MALVDDRPGVTRDRREGEARLGDLDFTIIDTAGLEEAGADTLAGRMMAQTKMAIEQADAVFFMLDAKTGPVPEDRAFAYDYAKRLKARRKRAAHSARRLLAGMSLCIMRVRRVLSIRHRPSRWWG